MGFWLLKPNRGGAAFWRSFMAIVDWDKFKELGEVEVLALRLHSRSYLYVVPDELISDVPPWVRLYAARIPGIEIKEWGVRRLTIRYREHGEWWVVRYIEVCDERRCFKVFRSGAEKHYVEGLETVSDSVIAAKTESDTGLAKTESETEVAAKTESDSEDLRSTGSETDYLARYTVSETAPTESDSVVGAPEGAPKPPKTKG